MTLLPSQTEPPDLADILRRYPAGVRQLLEFHDVVLRGPSPLSVGQREMLAAYVSGLNECEFCFGAHSIIAAEFGIEEPLLRDLMDDLDAAGIEPRMRPLLRYVRKLTRHPGCISPSDAVEVFDAGWNEEALHDAVRVCALFNFMNRLVEGMGVKSNDLIRESQRRRHRQSDPENPSATTYTDYGRQIGVI